MRCHALVALTLAAGCGWGSTPAPEPVRAPIEMLDAPSRLLGTWKLDPKVLEDLRLDALDEVLGGGPVPTDAQWSEADLAWLTWASEVHARPATDPDRVALEKFGKERAERRLVVVAGSLSVVGVDGTWKRDWTLLSSEKDPSGADLLSIQTSDAKGQEQMMVLFDDPDHVEIGPWGKTDQLVRWARVPDPS